MKKVTDWPSFGPKMKIQSEWGSFVSLDEPRFHWLLDADRGWHGWQTPQTYKISGINPHKYDEDGGGC
jgi:hypothetical protein